MKLLFFVTTMNNGGAEKVLINIVNMIDKKLFDVNVLSLFNEGDLHKKFDNNIKFTSIVNVQSKSVFINKVKKKLVHMLVKFLPAKLLNFLIVRKKYDLQIAFLEGMSTKIISGYRFKKIAWVHTNLNKFHWTKSSYRSLKEEKRCYQRFDDIYSVSNDVKEGLFNLFQVYSKVQINLIDSKNIISLSENKFNKINPEYVNIVSVGRLVKEKGYERLLSVFKKINNNENKYFLHIIGDGNQRKDIETYISNNDLQSSVTLWGYQDNPYKIMSRCDLFVSSSYFEGLSSVVIEALLLKLPIVVTDTAGMNDILGDSEYGLIVANDDKSLYFGLKNMLTNTELLESYREKSRIRSSYFEIDNRVNEFQDIFLKYVENSKRKGY